MGEFLVSLHSFRHAGTELNRKNEDALASKVR